LNIKSLNKTLSSKWLDEGKILVHPTESIWGLGCDAFNKKAVQKIFLLKKRNANKSFILLSSSVENVQKFTMPLNNKDKNFIDNYWPGPFTLLIKYNDKLPSHLKNETGKVAFRVSDHLPIVNLFKAYKGFMVSTSANISGQENMNDPREIINYFKDTDLAFYNSNLGKSKKPSTIIDLETRNIIRS